MPSDGANEGVHSDSDFYVRPVMKTREIAQLVSEAMGTGEYRLIACNLAAPDMVGHLLPTRFDAADRGLSGYGGDASGVEWRCAGERVFDGGDVGPWEYRERCADAYGKSGVDYSVASCG